MNENKPTDDDYGLPEEQFEPIDRSQSEEDAPLVERRFDYNEKKSNAGAIAIVVVAVLLVAGAIFGYFYFFGSSGNEEAAQNQFQDVPIGSEEDINQDFSDGQVSDDLESSDWGKASTTTPSVEPVKPAKGTIEMINARSGRYHIVIGSFIDDDLARDHGNKLAEDGVSTKIIVPYGDIKYYRLSVADYPTVDEAISHLGAMKANYGNDIWVLKY